MNALVLVAPGTLEYKEVPEPKIESPTDAIVQVAAVGICGSDTHGYAVVGGRRVPPIIMGHEFCGTIAELGTEDGRLGPGDRVFVLPWEYCGRCDACLVGAEYLCRAGRVYGADLPGAFAERVRISSRNTIPLPASVSSEQGTLVEPLSVVLHGLRRVNVQAGGSVAVVGAGAIGLLAVAVLALHSPRELIVIEPNTVRRELAIRLGATTTIDPTEESPVSMIADLTNGTGVDVVVEAAGISATVGIAIDVIRHGGVVVWLGNAGRTIEIDEFQLVWKQLTLAASVGMTRQSVRRAISLIAEGEIATQEVITDVVPLSDGVVAFHRQATDNNVVKTVLIP